MITNPDIPGNRLKAEEGFRSSRNDKMGGPPFHHRDYLI
jgi:hypothetical protein